MDFPTNRREADEALRQLETALYALRIHGIHDLGMLIVLVERHHKTVDKVVVAATTEDKLAAWLLHEALQLHINSRAPSVEIRWSAAPYQEEGRQLLLLTDGSTSARPHQIDIYETASLVSVESTPFLNALPAD